VGLRARRRRRFAGRGVAIMLAIFVTVVARLRERASGGAEQRRGSEPGRDNQSM
jgi:hypothetical protein